MSLAFMWLSKLALFIFLSIILKKKARQTYWVSLPFSLCSQAADESLCSQAIQILVIVELGRACEKVSEKAMGEKRARRINVTRQCHKCHIGHDFRNAEPELQAFQSRHHGLLRLGLLRLGLGRLMALE